MEVEAFIRPQPNAIATADADRILTHQLAIPQNVIEVKGSPHRMRTHASASAIAHRVESLTAYAQNVYFLSMFKSSTSNISVAPPLK